MPVDTMRSIECPLDAVAAEPLQLLLGYWRELAGDGRFARFAELRPERFAQALTHVAVIERVPEADGKLRIRLCGGDIENRETGYVRGGLLDAITPAWYRDHLLAAYRDAMARAVPIHQRVEVEAGGRKCAYTRLILPLSSDGAACDMLIVGAVRPADRNDYRLFQKANG